MTEDEAKTKWCPMSRVAVFPAESIAYTNRGKQIRAQETTVGQAHGCTGSACMAWRWSEHADDLRNTYDELGNWTGRQQVPLGKDRQGACGLVGKE